MPTLALMEDRGTSDRHLAAALAAILAMAPANAVFPLAALGLEPGRVLLFSALGGLSAAACSFHVIGRHLSNAVLSASDIEQTVRDKPSLLKVINVSGAEAIQIVINIIPLLLLSLLVVLGLQKAGAIDALVALAAPVLLRLGFGPDIVLLAATKYLAGSTALVGIIKEMTRSGHMTPATLNNAAAFLLHPLDLPGVAILVSAGVRVGRACPAALAGACVGIAVRMALGGLLV